MGLRGAWLGIVVGLLVPVTMMGAAAGIAGPERARVADPTATTASGRCWGGPGAMVLTVRRVASEGERIYRFDVTARRLAAGSRWTVAVWAFDDEARRFHRLAVDGEWSLSAEVTTSSVPFFYAVAHERTNRDHGCRLATGPSPLAALTKCWPGLSLAVAVRRPENGTVAVPLYLARDREHLRWHVRLSTAEAGASQTVAFDDLPNNRGALHSRVEFQGIDNPRVRIIATRADGLHCTLGFNPRDVTRADRIGSPVPSAQRRSLLDLMTKTSTG